MGYWGSMQGRRTVVFIIFNHGFACLYFATNHLLTKSNFIMNEKILNTLIASKEKATQPVNVEFSDIHELNCAVNSYNFLYDFFVGSAKDSDYPKEFWGNLASLKVILENELDNEIINKQ